MLRENIFVCSLNWFLKCAQFWKLSFLVSQSVIRQRNKSEKSDLCFGGKKGFYVKKKFYEYISALLVIKRQTNSLPSMTKTAYFLQLL